MSAVLICGDALALPLGDDTVDLVVTSPPYFGLRSYQDGGKHYAGQVGSEPTPAEFVDALIAATVEMVRVLKPSGSIWVNLGDKYSGAQAQQFGGKSRSGDSAKVWAQTNPKSTGIPNKSLMGIPWRYALRCIDDLGLILRAEVVWSKPNGMPESVTDRVRRSHEQWFHFTTQPRYYSAVDAIREAHLHPKGNGAVYGGRKAFGAKDLTDSSARRQGHNTYEEPHPLGKLPGSVWTIATQPLIVPPKLEVDHFAAFPMEWPRRIIQGWSPPGICTECGEGRRPVIATVGLNMDRPQARRAQELADRAGLTEAHFVALRSVGVSDVGRGKATQTGTGRNTAQVYALADEARAALGGYAREYLLRRPTGFTQACACSDPAAPTVPAVVLDPFGGTGTTALVASVLGRTGISVDLSGDYCRLAQWRTTDPGNIAAAMRVDKPETPIDGQLSMFDFQDVAS